MQRGFAVIHLIVLVLVLALVGGAYYFGTKNAVNKIVDTGKQEQARQSPSAIPSPSNDETADWKSYASNKLGFSFRYPSDWYAAEQGEVVYVADSPIPTIPLTHGLPEGLQITVSSTAPDTSPPGKHNSMQITLGGKVGTKTIDQEISKSDGAMRTRVFVKNSNLYYTVTFSNNDLNGTHNVLFDQILDTFKFN